MKELVVRFFIGGSVVSLFAVIADTLKPKSFAGLFGAAPSIALATLGLTISVDGKSFAALEARSMVGGAAAFLVYACLCVHLMMKHGLRAMQATISGLLVWFLCAFGAWLILR
jgi:uncharacterized membrane protein (GlpM family)